MALSAFIGVAPVFGDDQRILDDLYNQIMGASVQEHQGTMDSGESKSIPIDRFPAAGPNSEILRQEIEKLIEEAKQRHSDAVKFMREDNR